MRRCRFFNLSIEIAYALSECLQHASDHFRYYSLGLNHGPSANRRNRLADLRLNPFLVSSMVLAEESTQPRGRECLQLFQTGPALQPVQTNRVSVGNRSSADSSSDCFAPSSPPPVCVALPPSFALAAWLRYPATTVATCGHVLAADPVTDQHPWGHLWLPTDIVLVACPRTSVKAAEIGTIRLATNRKPPEINDGGLSGVLRRGIQWLDVQKTQCVDSFTPGSSPHELHHGSNFRRFWVAKL
jgi:hypothetical protein